jgi:UDP-N-acetylmuramoyl-tripeptide--D-alanyl-D-alanine ligase
MSFNEAAGVLETKLVRGGNSAGFSSVCIDSREAKPHSLFVALAGTQTDGHRFVKSAFENGAVCALVERAKAGEFDLNEAARRAGASLLPVDNSLHGLQTLSRAYLEKFKSLVRIGITGSSGKSTTKELAAAMAGAEKKVVYNHGNLNSETGLPLSIFTVRSGHEIGIFEAGMNRRGEIHELASVLKPRFALVTNIGSAHVGCIGSIEGIAAEKKAIFSEFTGTETAFIPEYDDFAPFLAEKVNGKVRFFGENAEKKSGRLTFVKDLGFGGWEIVWEGREAHFALPGAHNLKNALAAAAIASGAGISADSIRAGLESAAPLFGRSEIVAIENGEFLPVSAASPQNDSAKVRRMILVRDCYNANPESSRAAIDLCDAVGWKGKKAYVLGSMLELGEKTEAEHRGLGKILAGSNADMIFLFGEETAFAFDELKKRGGGKNIFQTNDIEELKSVLKKNIVKGDMILLKGSRGCALERVCDVLKECGR